MAVLAPGVLFGVESLVLIDPGFTFNPPGNFLIPIEVEPSLNTFTDWIDSTLTHPNATSGYRQVEPGFTFNPPANFLIPVEVEPSLNGYTDWGDDTLTEPNATSGYRNIDPGITFVPPESFLLPVDGQQGSCLEHGDF